MSEAQSFAEKVVELCLIERFHDVPEHEILIVRKSLVLAVLERAVEQRDKHHYSYFEKTMLTETSRARRVDAENDELLSIARGEIEKKGASDV